VVRQSWILGPITFIAETVVRSDRQFHSPIGACKPALWQLPQLPGQPSSRLEEARSRGLTLTAFLFSSMQESENASFKQAFDPATGSALREPCAHAHAVHLHQRIRSACTNLEVRVFRARLDGICCSGQRRLRFGHRGIDRTFWMHLDPVRVPSASACRLAFRKRKVRVIGTGRILDQDFRANVPARNALGSFRFRGQRRPTQPTVGPRASGIKRRAVAFECVRHVAENRNPAQLLVSPPSPVRATVTCFRASRENIPGRKSQTSLRAARRDGS